MRDPFPSRADHPKPGPPAAPLSPSGGASHTVTTLGLRVVADQIGVRSAPTAPWLVALLVVAATLLAANAVALAPGLAGPRRPATVLRCE